MSAKPHLKQYSFQDVARLVSKGKDPTDGLALHFRYWAWPMEAFPNVEPTPPIKRRAMIDALTALNSAADTILGGLHDGQQMAFVMAPKFEQFDRIALHSQLLDLKRRCIDSINSPALSSAKGGGKPGPGSASQTTLRKYCASVILLAWQTLHGEYPGSRNPSAAEAAEAFFRLASAPAGKPEMQLQPKIRRRSRVQKGRRQSIAAVSSNPNNPLNAWRRHFELARSDQPILGVSQGVYLNHLCRALGIDELLHGQDIPGGLNSSE
jgi:hypothetical protein